MSCVASDDVVFRRVISGPPAKNMHPDLVLADLVDLSVQSAIGDIQQEVGKQGRPGEARTRGDPSRQLPTPVADQMRVLPLQILLQLRSNHGCPVGCIEVY